MVPVVPVIPVVPVVRVVPVVPEVPQPTSHRVLDPQDASDQVRRLAKHPDATVLPHSPLPRLLFTHHRGGVRVRRGGGRTHSTGRMSLPVHLGGKEPGASGPQEQQNPDKNPPQMCEST